MGRFGLSTPALLAACLLGVSAPALAVDFKGKTISMFVGSEPGGGTDASGRLTAPFFEKYLPGNPSIVVRNMPGAQGITMINYVMQQTKPDGLTIIAGSSSQADPLVTQKSGALYDAQKLLYIGGLGRGGNIIMVNAESEKRLLDKSKPPLFFGALDGERSSEQAALWGIEYLGWNAKWVLGYRGTQAVMLALERGEIDMNATANLFQIKAMTESGKFHALSQSGQLAGGRFIPRPEFPDVPVLGAEIEPKIKEPLARQAFAYFQAINALDKWTALLPGTPEDVVLAYRTAFETMSRDPDFIERGRRISGEMEPMTADNMQFLVREASGMTEETAQFVKAMQRRQGLDMK
jgi:tripartite-type tricarboxylate transporter receptor subunit TctC